MSEDKYVAIELVPVQVFGGDPDDDEWGYGLMDATSAWSDCNRAIGHIFRAEDLEHNDSDRETITVLVQESDLWFFEKNWDKE